ncbi:MAG: tRNA (cytidine(34)-2'-O)-methyltransferase [Chlamydiales bacterium]|nr:tRNA (cytidine(34)-2'-O)-methyltransferase [Chlamydiales bacterium]
MRVVLFEPQIPQNTGNIARTCAVTGASLLLIEPLGFSISKRQIRRAGLDYWDDVAIETARELPRKALFFSTKGKKIYTEASYSEDSVLVFGSETSGLPEYIHEECTDNIYTIPMRSDQRSLNLSNSVAIVLYEALRQLNFAPLV